MLFDAKDVAHSIPRRVSTLLDVFVNTYPQPAGSLNPSGLPIAPEETLRCACEAAGALIGVDDVAAMRHLLDLLRLAPDGSDAEETGRKLIDSLLCEPEGDWRGDAHARRARLLEAIGRWAESAHGPVSVRVAAYAAGQAIAVTFTAMSRTAEDNMRFRFSAWAVDRDPVHARLVLGAAALLGTIVPRLDEAGLMLVLDRMAELDRIAAGGEHAGPVGPGTHAGAWGRRLLRTSTSLVASVFAGQWARLPHRVRRRVALMQPAHPLVASAAAADVELQRVTQSLTATGDADHEGFAAVLERDGLEAAAGVVAAIAADETIDAAAVPLAQALATAISSDTARAIARALTPAALQAFLPAALAAHPALGDLVDGFVARPETSAAVAAALDALEPDAERATLRALAAAGDVTACVRHLKQCARLDRAGRAAAALQLAVDARSGDCARTVLAAWDDHDALTDPATLNDALQLGLTDCREVATELTPAIARLGELDPGAWADVVLGWLQRMLDTEGLQPPEPFRQVRSRLAPPAALVLVERAAAWAQQRLDAPRWRHVESVVDTLITAPGATEARDAAILRFATGPQSHVTFAARMVAHCCDDDVWFAALGPLLRAPLTPTDRRLLNDSMLRGLPSEGSQAEHLETRGETLARRPPPADPIVAAFLRDAVDRLRETAQTVRERERRDSEGYD